MISAHMQRTTAFRAIGTLAFLAAFIGGIGTVYANGKTLVVYSAGPKGLADHIEKGFGKKTGITVELFQSTTGKILSRLEAEKANPKADVVVLASWPSAQGLKDEGLLLPYPGAKNADKLFPTWIDKDDTYFGYSASALGIAYNTTLVKNPPQDWSDLTQAKWRDNVNFPDPSLSGSALDFVSGYIADYGQEGWSLFDALKKNGVLMSGANAEALAPVITGAKDVVIAGVDYMTYAARAKGEPVDMIYPKSGTVINPRPAMILKSSPHIPEAKAFIDYLLSDQAQEMVANAYLLPGRTDIPAKDRPSASQIPLLKYDWTWMAGHEQEISSKLTDLFK
jgi:iron(III) transport system substrate-binding protein